MDNFTWRMDVSLIIYLFRSSLWLRTTHRTFHYDFLNHNHIPFFYMHKKNYTNGSIRRENLHSSIKIIETIKNITNLFQSI